VSRSRLKPLVRLTRPIRNWKKESIAYIRLRLTNGLVEGLNNKVRVITDRVYAFQSLGRLISMISPCCGGIVLTPPLSSLTQAAGESFDSQVILRYRPQHHNDPLL